MDKPSAKTIYVCENCGRESLKWLGRCPGCQEWNCLVPQVNTPSISRSTSSSPPQQLCEVSCQQTQRIKLPWEEWNRVLGGGLVAGSLVLLGGDPGIGKSTMLLQVSDMLSRKGDKVVYVSGEESPQQIKLRAERLGVDGKELYLLAETDLEAAINYLEEVSPQLAIIDSIQTVYLTEAGGAPGSLTQLRECTLRLMRWAKPRQICLLLAGHVTKDGTLAGPRVLEHIVDVVLYLEGERFSSYRLLRGVKNRFGSTNEVGIFEMGGQGLQEVANPSQVFLSQHAEQSIGSVVVPTLEGTRPLLVEIQALTSPATFGPPRRTANGIDMGRLLMVSAVLSKRAGLVLGNQDIIANAVGGLDVSEPAADLALSLAIASSLTDRPVNPRLAALGEVGLSGELRAVPQLERRLVEAARLGFQSCLVPAVSSDITNSVGLQVVKVNDLRQALRLGLGPKVKQSEKGNRGGEQAE